MAGFNLKARCYDNITGKLLAQSPVVPVEGGLAKGAYIRHPSWSVALSDPGKGGIAVAWGTHLADAVGAALSAPDFAGKGAPATVEVSLDGGATWPIKCTVTGDDYGLLDGEYTLDCPSIFAAYTYSSRERASFAAVPLGQILSGAPGTITLGSEAGAPRLSATGTMPGVAGVGRTPVYGPGWAAATRYAFSFEADPRVADLLTTLDINADPITDALIQLAKVAASIYDPGDPAPFGARQYYSVDVPNQRCTVGYAGSEPVLRLRQPAIGEEQDGTPDLATAFIDADHCTFHVDLTQQRAVLRLLGGPSNHGLPDGYTFTGLVVDNPGDPTSPDPDNPDPWRSLPIVSVTTGNEGGGLFFYAHDHVFRRMSQTMDCFCLAYDPGGVGILPGLLVGTSHGVYSLAAIPSVAGYLPLARLGGLTAKIVKVWSPEPGICYALADESNGAGGCGLYRYPQIGTETDDNATVGHQHWSRPGISGLLDAAGTDAAMYVVDRAAPGVITLHLAGQPDGVKVTGLDDEVVVGLDYLPALGMVFVRTEAGAAGLYQITAGAAVASPAEGRDTLADAAGQLSVTCVAYSGYPRNGIPTGLLVGTDRGPYAKDLAGGDYFSMQAQSGIGEVQATFLAAGAPQTVLCTELCRLWACSDTAFWESNKGGIWWEEVTALPVTGGPAFTALYTAMHPGQIPDNTVAGIGNAEGAGGLSDTANFADDSAGPCTTVVAVPSDGPGSDHRLPDGLLLVRLLTDRGDFAYGLEDTNSRSPYYAHEHGEVGGVVADDTTGPVQAGDQLFLITYRDIAQKLKPLVTLELGNVTWQDPGHALATIKGGDMVAVDLFHDHAGPETTTVVADLQDSRWWLLHAAHSFASYETIPSSTLLLANSTALSQQQVADLLNSVLYTDKSERRRPGRR